jgi:chromosome segregation ATPase
LFFGIGMIASLIVAVVAVGYLHQEREHLQRESKRADANSELRNRLQIRLDDTMSELERLHTDRRELLRHIRSAESEAQSATQLAGAWSTAHQQAVSETYRVANQWQAAHTRLEQNLGAVRNQFIQASWKLDDTKAQSELSSTQLNNQIRQLGNETSRYKGLSQQLENEIGSLRGSMNGLQSENNSLRQENSSLRCQISSLQSEVNSLRCRTNTCTRCGHHH